MCAYDIKISLIDKNIFESGIGSPEVLKIKNTNIINLSCEFPSPVYNKTINGGI